MVQRTINPYFNGNDDNEKDDDYRRYKDFDKQECCDKCNGKIGSTRVLIFRQDKCCNVFCSHKCYLDSLT
jgi:hypothetical protein